MGGGVRAPPRFRDQRRDAGLGRDRAAEALAGPERRKLLRGGLASLGPARRDQHAGPGGEQRLGANPTDAGRSAGHERRPAADGKKLGWVEHGLPAPVAIC
jgi:hypothetical protein